MIHLITYSNHRFEKAKERLCIEAKETNWFNTITGYSPNDLTNNFKNKYKNILNLNRGGGYCLNYPFWATRKND
jgi:hypothetical protein